MDKNPYPTPCSVPGSFSTLPIDVLLEVSYTDVSSAIKMTLVGNSSLNQSSGPA